MYYIVDLIRKKVKKNNILLRLSPIWETPDFCLILKCKHVLETGDNYLQYETELKPTPKTIVVVCVLCLVRLGTRKFACINEHQSFFHFATVSDILITFRG